MKILAPIDKVDEVEEVIKAGADELYCGLLWEVWLSRYTIAAINRRPARVCNLKSFPALKEVVKIAHLYNVPVSLTINEHYHTQEQYPLLLEYARNALDAGVDSFIIGDPSFILALNEANMRVAVHLSTGSPILNSEAVKFFQGLKVSRVILERQLTTAEIRKISKNVSNIETCVFILNSRCPNVDGLCTFDHVQTADPAFKNACMLPYSVCLDPETSIPGEAEEEKTIVACVRQQVWSRFHIDDIPCGACALYDFEEMGIDYAKIVGRGNQTRRKVNDIKFIRTLLTLLKDRSISRKEYIEKTQAFYSYIYKRPCRTVMCYYPEVGFTERILHSDRR